MGTILQQGEQQQQQQGEQQQQQQQGEQQQQQQGQQGDFSFHNLIGADGKFQEKWTEKLPDAFKPYASYVERFPTVTDLIAGYGNAQKLISKKTSPPTESSTPEQIAEWRKLVGAPDKPDGYGQIKPEKLPDGVAWDDALASKLAEIGVKHHMPKAALADLAELHIASQIEASKRNAADAEAYVLTQTEELKKEWKGDYQNNVQQAAKAASVLGVDLTDPDIGSNAKMIKVLHAASLLMREDKMLGGDAANATRNEQAEAIRRSDDYQGKNGIERQREALRRVALIAGEKI